MTTATPTQTIELDVLDVGCPACGAEPTEMCLSNDGVPYKSRRFHPERKEFCQSFIDKATGNTSTARWWRWNLRTNGPSAAPRPHGTMAGYQRHKREHTEVCPDCLFAAREYWNEQNARLRA